MVVRSHNSVGKTELSGFWVDTDELMVKSKISLIQKRVEKRYEPDVRWISEMTDVVHVGCGRRQRAPQYFFELWLV